MRWSKSADADVHVASHAADFPDEICGLAVTVLLKKESNHDPDALKGMLAAIDQDLGIPSMSWWSRTAQT